MNNKVVSRAHIRSLEVSFEMLVGVESQGYVELFPFVYCFLAWGEANGESLVGEGPLYVDGNVSGKVAFYGMPVLSGIRVTNPGTVPILIYYVKCTA